MVITPLEASSNYIFNTSKSCIGYKWKIFSFLMVRSVGVSIMFGIISVLQLLIPTFYVRISEGPDVCNLIGTYAFNIFSMGLTH